MSTDPDRMTSQQRLDHLVTVISSPRFLQMQGLGNEVPFFLCPYPPQDAVAMESVRGQVIRQLTQRGVRLLHINLYDLAVELLKERGIWDEILAVEAETSKDEIKELLQGVLDPEHHLVPAIASRLREADCQVLILSGVGEVYPYIRSHNVLNNLQSTAKDMPTVLFFPGRYTHSLSSGASLDLFGLLHDDKYYRAFNILNYEVSTA